MRAVAIGLVAAALGAGYVSFATPARAQPPGSYLQTCRNVRVDHGMLKARCLDLRGRPRRTSLFLPDCRGEIENVDGVLTCRLRRGPGPGFDRR